MIYYLDNKYRCLYIKNFNMTNKMRNSFYLFVGLAIVFVLPSVTSAATLSVSPSSQTVRVGDTFTVSVQLDTQGSSIDGVDIRYLSYNPSLLQVQDSNTSVSGIQISPGKLMPSTLLNSVDNSLGRIAFSQVAMGGTKYSGSGILATITFKAILSGTANLTFSYTSRNTTDSNVAAAGTDILNAVINGSYAIRSGSTAPVSETTPIVSSPTNVVNKNKPASDTPFVSVSSGDLEASSSDALSTAPSSSKGWFGSIMDVLNYIIRRISNGISRIFGNN